MMAKRVSIKHKRMEAPDWVFPWRKGGDAWFPGWFAILLVGAAFAFFVTSVRIRVTPPMPWAAKKAALIQVTDDAEGRALTLRAREGGPFPSRFEPSEWAQGLALERAAFEAARWTPPPYQAALRDLPTEPPPVTLLAAKGEPVLPKRSVAPPAAANPGNLKLAPRLFPLSGITQASMPHELPPFAGEVDAAMTAETWRFLVRLDVTGNVIDCISLTGGDEAGAPALETWLRGVSFLTEPSKTTRWIAVGVGFINQASDGTDAR
jgi:hypothetical protein